MLINLLPGARAAEWRTKSADLLVRYLGGDLALVEEIRRNREAQAALAETAPAHPARLFGEAVEEVAVPAVAPPATPEDNSITQRERESNLQMQEAKTAMVVAEATDKRKRSMMDTYTFYRDVADTEAWLDDRDRVAIKDYRRNLLRRMHETVADDGVCQSRAAPLAIMGAEPVSAPLSSLGRRALEISAVAKELGAKCARGDLIKYGKLVVKAYRTTHGRDPAKAMRYVDGQERPIKCYYEEDMELISKAIRSAIVD